MPLLTRCFLRSGFLCLLLGLGLAVAVTVLPSTSPWIPALWPAQVHLITVGWLTQLIFGVAWWLFPRAPSARWLPAGWTSFALLQPGLAIRVGTEPLRFLGQHSTLMTSLLIMSAVLQWLAVAAFTVAIWPRIRSR
jgi:hypothetical protein